MTRAPADPLDDDLPEAVFGEVADAALGEPAARATRLSELKARHPEHAVGIDKVAAAISGSDRLLAAAFPGETVEMPATIGRYRVLRQLGEGAFGLVYLAAESEPVRREVAIKVMRPGAGDRFTLQRFAAEQQLLASLDHPAIVRILEAGALPDGRPYFVMDRIDGAPLGEHARARSLALVERVRLFVAVCRGVQHAHARGVVHRDLKPANVLVAEVDGAPAPRIIDFGIAKLLAVGDGARPFATDPGRMVGTPGYMSPEQRVGGAAAGAVDARADVFALGVTLFELLVGERPWPGDVPLDGTEAPRASAARQRGAKAGGRDAFARQLRGDLDRILAKALQHAPGDRYADAGALADDLQAHLDGRPIAAERPSLRRAVRRSLRRHRSRWLAAAALAVVAGAGFGGVGYWRAQAERADDRRIEEALQMAEVLLRRASSPMVNDALDDAARAQLAADVVAVHERLRAAPLRPLPPEALARSLAARQFLAETQHAIGAFDAAITMAQEMRAEAEALVAAAPTPANRRLLAGVWREIGRSAFMLRRYDVAREATTKAVAGYAAVASDARDGFDDDHCKALVEHASALGATGDLAGQLAAQQQAVERMRQRVGSAPDDENSVRDLVRNLSGLANLRIRRNDAKRAEAALLEAMAVIGNTRFPLAEERARIGSRLGKLRLQEERFAEALAAAVDARDHLVPVVARQPNRHVERLVLLEVHALRATAHERLGDPAAAAVAGADLVEAAKLGNAAARRNAAIKLTELVRIRHERGDQRDLAVAAGWLDAARSFLPAGGKDGELLCEIRVLRAMVAAQRGEALEVAELEDLAEAAGRDAPAQLGWARALLVQRLLDVGAAGRAAAVMAERTDDDAGLAPWWAQLGIRLAVQQGDVAAARAAITAAASAQLGVAIEAVRGAALLLRSFASRSDSADVGAFVRGIATDFLATHGDGMDDAGPVELWLGQAQAVALLAATSSPGAFDARQERALAVLGAARPKVARTMWDEALWFGLAQRRLAAQLAAGGASAALATARGLLPDLDEPAQLLAICDVLADCLAADAPGAYAAAIDEAAADAVRRAVAVGLRRGTTLHPALARLAGGRATAAAIAAIPE